MIFYREQVPAEKLPQNWQDRGKSTPRNPATFHSPDPPTTWVKEDFRMLDWQDQKNKAVKLEQPEVRDNPGSGKVIPEGKDFENKKSAALLTNILNSTSAEIRDRARGLPVSLRKRSKEDTMWAFGVSDYVVSLEVVPQMMGLVRSPTKADVRVACSCPFWRYQGPEYWAKEGGYLFGSPQGKATPPKVRDPKNEHRVCKHVVACFHRIQQEKMRSPWNVLWDKIQGLVRKSHFLTDNTHHIEGDRVQMGLRGRVIRLAYTRPDLRSHLLPILKEGLQFTPERRDLAPSVVGWKDYPAPNRGHYVKKFEPRDKISKYTLEVWFDHLDSYTGSSWRYTLTGYLGPRKKQILDIRSRYFGKQEIPKRLKGAERAALQAIKKDDPGRW